ncbi:MAG: glycosyltransferase family 4 protein [Anaerolineae bacterium]|nr:glycosyltransferase family 4 protein [Anaerolineae bacterium]
MKKILVTTTSYPPAIGGAQLHTHQILKRLSPNFPVQVITHWAENRTDWLFGTTLNAPAKPKAYTFEDIPVQLITLTRQERRQLWPYVLGYYAIKPTAIDKIAARLMPKIELLARDCSLIHNMRIGREPISFASFNVARKRGIPFVFVPYHHPRWVGWKYREYLNLYRQADALIALTQAEKETLIALGVAADRIFVTGIGPVIADQTDPAAFREQVGIPSAAPLVLFLGQKYRYKGYEALAAAAKIVWAKLPETRFLFIGPQTTASKKFFARHQDHRVIELGKVDVQQKSDALAACTLLCLPSTQESFGGVYTEAWSFGKPVIGANIPAVAEVIDDGINGYVVPPMPQEIAERILYLLNNPTIAHQLGQAGRQKVIEKYSWHKLAQKTEEIYTTILTGHSRT